MPISYFKSDLNKERILGEYLDERYLEIFAKSTFKVKRIHDKTKQLLGIDLILYDNSRSYNIDEKAQLDYLNQSLPTFAFELSYLKKEIGAKVGSWMDPKKRTCTF